ncbi:MAG TPA: adenosine deaminase, partial [Conexibacter sp.]|nr:adenosine deaminase [Conexibacter sp.]
METDELYRRMPKAELHCHLIGTVQPETFLELADAHGVPAPSQDPERVFDYDPDDFDSFIVVYRAISASVRTEEDFSRIAYECLARAAARSNVRYSELFLNPLNHRRLAYPAMLDGLVDGIERARRDHGVDARLIPSINREEGAEAALELVDLVLAHPRDEVVGIGLDHNEDSGLPGLFAEPYRRAAAGGLRLTAHAGEFGSAERVRAALEQLGCERIDHGYGIVHDEALMADAREGGIHFTATWSASVEYHGDDPATQPVGRMIRAGLSVSINSDDPTIFRTDLAREWIA